MLGHQKNTGVV